MKSINILIVLILVSVLLLSCTQDKKTLILGVWEAGQVSQNFVNDEELVDFTFNYLKITETNINAKSFNMVAFEEGGSMHKVFNEEDKDMNYEWIGENGILVDDSLFDIKLKKNEMVLKNNNIEIHFYKKK